MEITPMAEANSLFIRCENSRSSRRASSETPEVMTVCCDMCLSFLIGLRNARCARDVLRSFASSGIDSVSEDVQLTSDLQHRGPIQPPNRWDPFRKCTTTKC